MAPPERASFAESLRYLNWLFNPLQPFSVPEVYDLLSTRSWTRDRLYLNLGYWRAATDLDSACEAMADLLAGRAGLVGDEVIVDAGFGFADQDRYWAEHYHPRQIIGLNLTFSQVATAWPRMVSAGLADRVTLLNASATSMPLPAASADVVFALESAFHFRTRMDFFREAYRVLRPGGRLVTADIVPMPTPDRPTQRMRDRLAWGFLAQKFSIPRANAYDRGIYGQHLRQTGFEGIDVQSIREAVYEPLARYLLTHPENLQRLHPFARAVLAVQLRVGGRSAIAAYDYLLGAAQKPFADPVEPPSKAGAP